MIQNLSPGDISRPFPSDVKAHPGLEYVMYMHCNMKCLTQAKPYMMKWLYIGCDIYGYFFVGTICLYYAVNHKCFVCSLFEKMVGMDVYKAWWLSHSFFFLSVTLPVNLIVRLFLIYVTGLIVWGAVLKEIFCMVLLRTYWDSLKGTRSCFQTCLCVYLKSECPSSDSTNMCGGASRKIDYFFYYEWGYSSIVLAMTYKTVIVCPLLECKKQFTHQRTHQ